MKKLLIIITILCIPFMAMAQDEEVVEETKQEPIKWCPKTLITDNDKCMTCHVMSNGQFQLKETKKDAHLNYPHAGMRIINFGTENEKGYFCIEGINSVSAEAILDILDYFRSHNIDHVVFEVYSPGGGVFAGWRIKALLDEWKAEGKIVETRVRSAAFSGGFVIAVAGSKGYRCASPTSEYMWHEIQSVEGGWLKIESTSQKEQEAKIFRHLQDNINSWLATRGKLTKEEIDAKVRYEEFWFTGKQAFEMGFVDKLIGQ